MRKITLSILSLLFSFYLFAQREECEVDVAALKGKYTGDCNKKGKADGNGIAIGYDYYEGKFKNGFPDGMGKYTWKNGDTFEGNWKKGVFDGEGTYKEVADGDNFKIVTGYWKKGKYIGKYESPYLIKPMTSDISGVIIKKINGAATITVDVRTITGGASSNSANHLPKATLTDIEVTEGKFTQKVDDELSSPFANKYTFRNVTFPFSAIFSFETIGMAKLHTEKVKIDFYEDANWLVQVNIEN